jgi:ABC-type hemin transport system ATPase subunit
MGCGAGSGGEKFRIRIQTVSSRILVQIPKTDNKKRILLAATLTNKIPSL